MGDVLNAKERKALDVLSFDHGHFLIKGELPRGVGRGTLDKLVALGLVEKGPSERYSGEIGYRVTPDGWRAQYGMTYEEIMALPDGQKAYPLRVMRWPPD